MGVDTAFATNIMLGMVLIFAIPSTSAAEDLGQVTFVNVLYRHGNRTPIDPYPTDPYRNTSFWPVGWGQLTDVGMRGHYELGLWLRDRYRDLLPSIYDTNDIFVQSTDVDRTLMSAYCNLAGLYQPNPVANWNPSIDWRPIPVHTTPVSADEVLSGGKACPRYHAEKKALLKTKFFKDLLEENMYLLETLSNATGMLIRDFTNVEYVYNTLLIENYHNYPLPAWTATLFPEPLRTLADFSFRIDCYTAQLARLKMGPLLVQMVNHLKDKAEGKLDPDRKMWVYSAHDTTVANLLQGLSIFNGISPPYYSTVLMELRKKDNNHFVTIFYHNSSSEPPHFLSLPGCASLCPLDKFLDILQPILPVDWEKECQLTYMEAMYAYAGSGVIAYIAAASLLLIILVIVFKMCRRVSESHDDIVYTSLSVSEAT